MSRTLVLDQSYRPHRIISWQRAVTMLFQDKIEVIEEYDEDIRSVSITIKMPAVVRLLRAVRGKKRAIKFSRINVATRDDFRCQYCISPGHKVLSSDLRWVPIEDLAVGDRLVGFDESLVSPGGRRFTDAVIDLHERDTDYVYRVTLEDGTVFFATKEHRWLTKTGHGARLKWKITLDLIGCSLPRVFDVWSPETTRASGWLAGIYDGEGWVQGGRGATVGVAQNEGAVLERVRDELGRRGFRFSESTLGYNCKRLLVSGAAAEKARFLGTIRPERLLHEFQTEMLGRVQAARYVRVASVEPYGSSDIIRMSTSTATFVAEGYPQHNCGDKKTLRKLTYDHVIPRSQGGKTTWNNIVMACYDCNEKKGDRTPEQAGMRLRKQPAKPRWLPVVAFRIDPSLNIPDAWANWLYWHGALEHGS